MRTFPLVLLLALSGCATVRYTSSRPKADVAHCIEEGWKNLSSWGSKLPVSVNDRGDYYYIRAGFHPSGGVATVTNTKHPQDTLWVEIWGAGTGSSTEYHRVYQAQLQAELDRIVKGCQD
ncbi:MAG TPA: hypothetical protein PLM37_10790 [Elusimicrobiota bacterium]|nr:hypothetical protein [Elusimicrobiota bacterium]